MKRTRIKAMVTVPMRRKATQDASVSEDIDVTKHEKHKSISDNICVASQQISENNLQENLVMKQTQNEHLHVNHRNGKYKDDSMMQNSDKFRKEIVQSAETFNRTEITSPTRSTQNRLGCMRPMPKLDSGGRIRRNSIQGSGASANESEDDSRRIPYTLINNIKNDLLQPIQNTNDDVVTNTKNNLTKSKVGQKRRILVSESVRKLAEARREFHLKHENKTPDRSKLTMYDLIYYNPATNPVNKSKNSGITTKKVLECQSEEFQEEEEEKENEDDPSSAMPVPQVKVGPNGQLIIDEQSLVIEQTNAKKGKEVLAKEAIIDDDNSGSGFYKKRQKSKEWPRWETLKFYKALNTVGTDFLLMQSLFPNRTRQEIKLKFKKEEKANRSLLEKELAYHQEFNSERLEKLLATFKWSENEYIDMQEKQKQETKKKRNARSDRKRKSRIVVASISQTEASDEEEYLGMIQKKNTEANNRCQKELNKADKKRYKRSKEENSLVETNDIETLSLYSDFDSDTEIYRVRQTRSGRPPKVKKLQGPNVNTLYNERSNYCSDNHEITMLSNDNTEISENLIFDSTNLDSETQYVNSIKTVIPNIVDVEPGSLVILSKELPEESGKGVLQVYMVGSNVNSQNVEKSNIAPLNLSPELLATVTTKLLDAESITVKEECE